jgi:hypothetical protein
MGIQVEAPDESLWRGVFGTAGESMPWWREVTFIEGDWDTLGVVRLGVESPDDESETVTVTVTITEVVAAYSAAMVMGYGHVVSLSDPEDMDAVGSDVLLQIMALGEVVYS